MENYRDLFSLEGKTALITGGTGGLGSAIALAFLQQGANVAVCGGHPEKAAGLADYAAQAGRKFLSIRCDIQKQSDIDNMLNEIEEQLDTLDILVNSAGMNRLLPAEDYTEEAFDQVMGLNVKGLHLITKAVGKRFMIDPVVTRTRSPIPAPIISTTTSLSPALVPPIISASISLHPFKASAFLVAQMLSISLAVTILPGPPFPADGSPRSPPQPKRYLQRLPT